MFDSRTKACWRWSRDRAQVISRWTWLQAQVSDLEYKIRQHGDLHRQLRAVKNPIIQPPNSLAEDNSMRAARCIPYINTQDRRHKIVRIANTPSLGPKGSKVIMMPCQCAQSGRQCAICAGHHNYFKPMDIHTYCRKERAAQVDKSFHPVLSFTRGMQTTQLSDFCYEVTIYIIRIQKLCNCVLVRYAHYVLPTFFPQCRTWPE